MGERAMKTERMSDEQVVELETDLLQVIDKYDIGAFVVTFRSGGSLVVMGAAPPGTADEVASKMMSRIIKKALDDSQEEIVNAMIVADISAN